MIEPNIIIAICIIVIITCYTYLLGKFLKIELKPVKFETIDGLRGYLAFCVFLHHACIYYYFFPTWNWATPPQNLYTHFGQTSVSLFFMITGFLFFNKLIESRQRKVDWFSFYITRIMRLYPLYLLVLSVMIYIVYVMSNFERMDKFSDLFFQIKDWFFFGVINTPSINGYKETTGIMASVIWSIRYEWLFYFSLPILSLFFFKQRPSIYVILISGLVCYYLYNEYTTVHFHFLSFLSGLIAAILIRFDKIKKFTTHFICSLIAITCLVCTVYFFNSAYSIIPLLLTSFAFIIIACGNSLFGLLTLKASKYLGQLSYSIYLLHTTLLFIVFRVFIGMEASSKFSLFEYWTLILGLGILLISISFLTYYKIELPSLNSAKLLVVKIRCFRNKINNLYFSNQNNN